MKKTTIWAFALLFISLLSGCSNQYKDISPEEFWENSSKKIVEKWDTIAVNYTGKLLNWKIFDSSSKPWRKPLEFTVGNWSMIKWFENWVLDMKIGETKTIKIKPENAYWKYSEERIIDLPKKELKQQLNNVQLKTWMKLRTSQGAAQIKNINETTVTVDLNHELAGKTLKFEIKLLKIKN